MQTKNEPVTRNKFLKENEKVENNNLNKNTNKTNKPIYKEEAGDSNKSQVGTKNFIETIYKKTLPNSNLIDKESIKLTIERNKLLDYQKEAEKTNQIDDIPIEIKSHRLSNNQINIGNVRNKDMLLATKDIYKRKKSNSFIQEKSESPVKSKEKLSLNNNFGDAKSKKEKNGESQNNNNLLNINNPKYNNNNSNIKAESNGNIKNIPVNFSKTSNNFNFKNSEIHNAKGNQVFNYKPANNNDSINNKNYMEIIEQKLNFQKGGGNRAKNKSHFNSNSKDENLIEKTGQKSTEKDKASRSNSKSNKSKTKFKSNQKLENHLGSASKTFYTNKKLNQKIELASSSSGFNNFFFKNKGNTNTKSEFDITKNSTNVNFNLALKNNEPIVKTIKIVDEKNLNKTTKTKLDSQLDKIANKKIDDYFKVIQNGNKENDQCNIIKNSSTMVNSNNKTSNNPELTNSENSNCDKLKIKNVDIQRRLTQDEDNILPRSPINNLFKTARRSKLVQKISIDSNKNSLNNSFDNVSGAAAKIQEKIINHNRIFSANTRLEKERDMDKLINYFTNSNAKESANNKENLIFNDYNMNSFKFMISQNAALKDNISASDKNNRNLISNSLNYNDNYFNFKNKNKINSSKINIEVKVNSSNPNENIFSDIIKSKKQSKDISEDFRKSYDRKNMKNLLSSTGFSNNSHSNLKNFLNTQESGLKLDRRIASPINKIDTKKLKIMIINKETHNQSDLKNTKIDSNKLNILRTNSNSNELQEEKAEEVSGSKADSKTLNFSEIKNIKIESSSKNIENDNSNLKSNNNNNNVSKSKNSNNPSTNITKTYSTLAKKLKKNKDSKQVLECSSNSNFEIISCKPDKKTEEENANKRNKSSEINKNISNVTKENQSNSKNLEFEIINQNLNLIKTNSKNNSNSNSNSNNDENFNPYNINKEITLNNLNLGNEPQKENLTGFEKKNRKNWISKNNMNLFNSANEANFNTKTTKDTLKLSYYQNKNFSNIEIEGPEELHMLYINLNQQNKRLIYRFEKIDDTIKTDKDNTHTVFNYDNEVEI